MEGNNEIKKVKVYRVMSDYDMHMVRLVFWFGILLFVFVMVKTGSLFMDIGPIQGWEIGMVIGFVSMFAFVYYGILMICDGFKDWWNGRK